MRTALARSSWPATSTPRQAPPPAADSPATWTRPGGASIAAPPPPTFPAALPILRIDHLFVSEEIVVRDVFAPANALTRTASDHLPLVMDFEVGGMAG